MIDYIYLVCDVGGVVKMTKRPPALASDQVAVKLIVRVPVQVFKTFTPEITIDVPERKAMQPPNVEVCEPD